ncbi:hypothetical protein HPB51_028056 [Rhipicephalus microplus]|uniref:Uncharacterized protein n=1 Tax=Rhipicephalus microplus TaxID=6941 RepID=A0A9J6CYH8_RHIMP|nr:hypothetical protein HPB51_028056 [Rhipicephalus microplus]
METVGLYRIFERSKGKRDLKYLQYYGTPQQERVGCRLKKLKKTVCGLGGKGKLSDALIDRLQNYYGFAIRANVGNLCGLMWASGLCPLGPKSWCGYQRLEALGQGKYVH